MLSEDDCSVCSCVCSAAHSVWLRSQSAVSVLTGDVRVTGVIQSGFLLIISDIR